jgi:hypothetical protein
VLDGPPGTGKSQTIANIIAEFLAAGKTVLFVSEKAAALEVVKRRLDDCRLGDFCLELHSHKANKRQVIAELGRRLDLETEKCSHSTTDLEELHQARGQLNDYVRELHADCPPLGMTVYQIHGELARLSRLRSKSCCPIPEVLKRDTAYLRHVSQLLAGLVDCRCVIADPQHHPWRGCRAEAFSPVLHDNVRHHFERLAGCLDQAAAATATLHSLGFSESSPTRAQWRASVETARRVLVCPLVLAGWFRGNPRSAVSAVIRLDELTKAYRETLAALPEFARDALRNADENALTAMAAPTAEPRQVSCLGDTVKSLREHLPPLGASLRELHTLAVETARAAQRVGELLLLSEPAPPVALLRDLAELASGIARLGPVPRSWWDAERRQELLDVIARCQKENWTARETRRELTARLALRAFAVESASLAIRASCYRSRLARMLPWWWWSAKPTVGGWYAGNRPNTPAMLDDLGKLADYHQRIDYCRQVREAYAADLAMAARGEPDWDRTLEDLQLVDRLAQFLKVVPDTLRDTLSVKDGLDRRALAAAGKELVVRQSSIDG